MFNGNFPGWKKCIPCKDLARFSFKVFQGNAFFCKKSCKILARKKFPCKNLARKKIPCKNLARKNISLRKSCKRKHFLEKSCKGKHFLGRNLQVREPSLTKATVLHSGEIVCWVTITKTSEVRSFVFFYEGEWINTAIIINFNSTFAEDKVFSKFLSLESPEFGSWFIFKLFVDKAKGFKNMFHKSSNLPIISAFNFSFLSSISFGKLKSRKS